MKRIQRNGKDKRVVISIDSQAFKLFEQGKEPVDVAIKLDIKSEEANRLYKEYCNMKGLYNFNQVYEEVNSYDILPFIDLYKFAKKQGMGTKQVVSALRKVEELPFIENQYQKLTNAIDILESQKYKLQKTLKDLRGEIDFAKQVLISLDIQINNKREKLAFLDS